MISVDAVREVLARQWDLAEVEITEHNGGMNSATWWVDAPDRRLVAKAVPTDRASDFIGGLTVAATLQRMGIPAGAAIPTTSGAVIATVETRPLALLEYVPGDELTENNPDDVRLVGTTLGRVHLALREAQVDGARPLFRIKLDASYMGVRQWIRPAVAKALDEFGQLDRGTLTTGLLHTDPAPEAFRVDRSTGVVGLIDWSVATRGPLLYDVASAVMYVGGIERAEALIESYLATNALPAAEVERGLRTALRYRGAVQAMYFAWRTANDDMTGIDDRAENEKGLTDARRMLS